jgi:hypothetical protein
LILNSRTTSSGPSIVPSFQFIHFNFNSSAIQRQSHHSIIIYESNPAKDPRKHPRLGPLNHLFRGAMMRYPVVMSSHATPTLEDVLTEAERLPAEDQRILADILRNRQIEAWRTEAAAAARQDIVDFEAGKLKPEPTEDLIARLNRPE